MDTNTPTCPAWDAFLDELMPNPNDRAEFLVRCQKTAPSSSVPFRVTHRLSLLTNHKPSAKLLGGGKWKLHEKRNA